MKRYFWLIVSFVISTAFLLFLFFVWRSFQGQEKVQESGKTIGEIVPKPVVNLPGQKVQPETQPIEAAWTLGAPKEPEFKPFFKEEGDKIKETFLERFSSLSNLPVSTPQFELPFQSAPATGHSAPAKPKRALTDEEWFKIAYPDYYINHLRGTERLMRDVGALSASEKFEFTSEEEIKVFTYKALKWEFGEGWITEQQLNDSKDILETFLPALHKEERRYLEENGSLSTILFNLLTFIKDSLTKKAFALGEVTNPDCYRQGISMGSGSNTFVLWWCCNCGTGYVGKTIKYYTDCGQLSSITCNVLEMGCLNSICPWPRPAIWDKEKNICGCDP